MTRPEIEILEWLLRNLGAGDACYLVRRGDEVKLTYGLGNKQPLKDAELREVKRVLWLGESVKLPMLIAVPVFGDGGKVAGALLLREPALGEPFQQLDDGFCKRCARWLEVARRGRSDLPLPPLQGEAVGKVGDPSGRSKPAPVEPGRFALRQPEVFLRSLQVMVDAGISLHQSLHFLAQSQEREEEMRLCRRLGELVSQGNPLSEAFHRFPRTFSEHVVSLIRVGERSGALPRVLSLLAEHLERSRDLSHRIRSSLVYPLGVVTLALLLLVLGPPMLLEGQLRMLEDSKLELPALTRVLIWWVDLSGSLWFWLSLGLAVLAVGWLAQAGSGRLNLWRLAWSLRPLRETVLMLSTTRFARAMAISFRAGIDIREGLDSAIGATGDPVFQARLASARVALLEGESLSGSLRGTGTLPTSFCEVLSSGEEVGRPDLMLDVLAHLYESELQLKIKTFTTLLEPMVLLGVGVVTTLVLVATVQPTLLLLQVA